MIKSIQRSMPRVALLIIALLVASSSGTAYALTTDQIKAFQSGVFYFNTEDDIVAACGASATLLAGNNNEEKIWNFLVSQPRGLSGPQAAGLMGNLQAESGENFDPTAEQVPGSWSDMSDAGGRAVGIAQWDGSRRPALINAATAQGKDPKDLAFQLEYLFQEATSRGDWDKLKATTTVAEAALSWHQNFERSADGPDRIQGRVNNGEDILKRLGSGAPASGGVTGGDPSACGSGSGVVAGNILKTALGLAWPDHGHGVGCELATPAFIEAHQQIYGPDDITHCTGCDVFVSTVMRSSGVDPNYPLFQTSEQQKYIEAHPEKYQIIGTTDGNTVHPSLQPGDILVYYLITDHGIDGHTLIYTGDQPTGFNMVDGSNGGHVPQSGNWGSGGWGATYTIVRVLN